jgi:repressor LexA
MSQLLTTKQKAVLQFVIQFGELRRIAPTLNEISQQFGYASNNAARDHLRALERKGYIVRQRHSGRSIEVIRKLEEGV